MGAKKLHRGAGGRRPGWLTSPPFRTTVIAILLIVLYFVVPVSSSDSYPVVRWAVTLICVGVAALPVFRAISKAVNQPSERFAGLLLSIIAGALAFAMLDYVIAIRYPGEFGSLQTRIDALYFALATITTIGYGDIHAEGQTARLIVIFQIIFNVVVIGAAVSLLASQIQQRVRGRSERP